MLIRKLKKVTVMIDTPEAIKIATKLENEEGIHAEPDGSDILIPIPSNNDPDKFGEDEFILQYDNSTDKYTLVVHDLDAYDDETDQLVAPFSFIIQDDLDFAIKVMKAVQPYLSKDFE